MHTSIGPPEQVNLFLYSTSSEYKLTDSRVCYGKEAKYFASRCFFIANDIIFPTHITHMRNVHKFIQLP